MNVRLGETNAVQDSESARRDKYERDKEGGREIGEGKRGRKRQRKRRGRKKKIRRRGLERTVR